MYLRELLRTFDGGDGAALGAPATAALVAEASVPTLAARVGRRVAKVAADAPALAVAMAVLGDGESLHNATLLAGLDDPRRRGHRAAPAPHRGPRR